MAFDLNEEFNKPLETGGTPVTEFWGVLKELELETNKWDKTAVRHDFIDVEVISSTEPYNFPTVRFSTTYDNREETRWAAEKKSIEAIIPAGSDGKRDINQLVGKRQHWSRLLTAKVRAPDPKDKDARWFAQDIPCWQLVEVEGFASPANSGVDIFDAIADLLGEEGMTQKDLNSKLLTDQSLKNIPGHGDVANTLMDGKQITTVLEAMGKAKLVGDKWVKSGS